MERMTHHDDFIEKPVRSILEEGLRAIGCIEHGIEVYPLYEYLLQSIFLKMTGFQEQKLKLIHWTIATYDDNERWEYQQNHADKYYSNYKEKNQLFKIICEKKLNRYGIFDIFGDGNYSYYRSCISTYYEKYKNERIKISDEISDMFNDDSCLDAKKKDELFAIIESFDQKVRDFKKIILQKDFTKTKEKVKDVSKEKRQDFNKKMQCLQNKVINKYFEELDEFDNSFFKEFLKKVTQDYNNLIGKSKYPEMFSRYVYMQNLADELIKKEKFDRSQIFSNLNECHELLYDHRNRCAHNTLSYQKNLPTLEVLADENHQKFDNYYIRFLILILIDEIFMVLFKKYKEIILSEMNV